MEPLVVIFDRSIRQGNDHERSVARIDIEKARSEEAITEEQYKYLRSLYETIQKCGS